MGQFLAYPSPGTLSKPYKVVMIGLDGAGKTTILYELKLGSRVQVIPTIGFNVETVEHNKTSLTIWDIGGQTRIRALWEHYYDNVNAIIFVVDSNDTRKLPDLVTYGKMKDKTETAKFQFAKMLNHKLIKPKKLPILIFANKSELTYSLSVKEVAERLDFSRKFIDFKVFLRKTKIKRYLTEEGIIRIVYDYLFWACDKIEVKNKQIHITPCCGETGKGLTKGLDWLVKALKLIN